MSPETGTAATTLVLEEAARIEQVLLAEQAQAQSTAHNIKLDLFGNTRKGLACSTPEHADESQLIDTRIASKSFVVTPQAVSQALPLSNTSAETTRNARDAGLEIIQGIDDRLLVVVGPCSIHDPESALVYASYIQQKREEYSDTLEIIMRAYMEKPRTELGWKGFMYDPGLDESYNINLGLIASRMLACQITNMGVPLAMERLNANTPQYVNGLIAYDAIGARNTTDQKAREYASGTSSIIGLKNTPEGSLLAAAEAIVATNAPHTSLGMDTSGAPIQLTTKGNESAHLILRGSHEGPNYSARHVLAAKEILQAKGLLEAVMIDVSHKNKVDGSQMEAIKSVAQQLAVGEAAIIGVMIESNLVAGNQKLIPGHASELVYGKSITDTCVNLEETDHMLQMLSGAVVMRRNNVGN